MFNQLQLEIVKFKVKYAVPLDNAAMKWNRFVARVMHHDVQWTFAFGFEDYDDKEYSTANEAEAAANEAFGDWCDDNIEDVGNGHTEEEYGELIKFFWDENSGERRVMERKTVTLDWEYYHGDYAEHNTHWGP